MSEKESFREWANFSWNELALELDYRAKLFSMRGASPKRRAPEGLILIDQLIERLNDPRDYDQLLEYVEWEWIFEPLVYKLLHSHSLVVCLGHFAGDRRNPERRWLYYFNKRLSCPLKATFNKSNKSLTESVTAFCRAFRQLSFNASHTQLATDCILLTTQLLEQLTPEGPKIDSTYPYGGPLSLLIKHGENPANQDAATPWGRLTSDRILTADWTSFFLQAATSTKDRQEILRRATSDEEIMEFVLNATTGSPSDQLPLVDKFLWEDDDSRNASLSRAEQYKEALEKAFQTPLQPRPSLEGSGQENFQRFLIAHHGAERRIAQYVAWVQDISEEISQVVTVPAWLPGEGSSGRSGSIILFNQEGKEIQHHELISFVNAFRLGCVNVAIEATEGLARRSALHRIPNMFASAISALVEQQEKHNSVCGSPLEIPPGFLLAVGTLFRVSGDVRTRPRWPWLEKELQENGVTKRLIERLFSEVATKIGAETLSSKGVILFEAKFPTLNVIGRWECDGCIGSEEATYLPALIGILLTEAWEHTAAYAREPDLPATASREVTVTVKHDSVIIENPCTVDAAYLARNQTWEIDQLLKQLPKWEVLDPQAEAIHKGYWVRTIRRKKDV
jgi:hypothetical protein